VGELASVDIGLSRMNGESGPLSQRSVVEVALATPVVGGEERLSILFGEFEGEGAGIESIEVLISRDGDAALAEVFTSVDAAIAFFAIAELDLGTFATASGETLVSYWIEVISSDVTSRVSTSWKLVVIPEPSSGLLILLGLLGLSGRGAKLN